VCVTLLLHCCYTVVTLWLHFRYTVVTLLLHCCYTAGDHEEEMEGDAGGADGENSGYGLDLRQLLSETISKFRDE
jgi:hypothetical protein